jgi:predicted DNA-binding protein (UPF0251 family)
MEEILDLGVYNLEKLAKKEGVSKESIRLAIERARAKGATVIRWREYILEKSHEYLAKHKDSPVEFIF